MRAAFQGAWLAALVLVGPVHGQPYTIKLKDQPDVNKPVVFREFNKQAGLLRVFDAAGKLVEEQKSPETTEAVYTVTILQAGQKRPAKYRRQYEKATWTDGQKTVTRSYQGRSILYELRVGQYLLTVDGKEDLPQDDFQALVKAANADVNADPSAVFVPPKPVRVGDSWPIPTKVLAETFGKDGVIDEKLSTGRATLIKAAEQNGHLQGVIEVDVRLAYQSMRGLNFDPPAKLVVQSTLETAIDGSSTAGVMQMRGKLTGKASIMKQGQKLLLELTMDFNGRQEQTEAK